MFITLVVIEWIETIKHTNRLAKNTIYLKGLQFSADIAAQDAHKKLEVNKINLCIKNYKSLIISPYQTLNNELLSAF